MLTVSTKKDNIPNPYFSSILYFLYTFNGTYLFIRFGACPIISVSNVQTVVSKNLKKNKAILRHDKSIFYLKNNPEVPHPRIAISYWMTNWVLAEALASCRTKISCTSTTIMWTKGCSKNLKYIVQVLHFHIYACFKKKIFLIGPLLIS